MSFHDINKFILTHIGVTPGGAYCLHCGSNFESYKWRQHFNAHHQSIVLTFPSRISNIVNILQYQIQQANTNGNMLSYTKSNKQYTRYQCTGCNNIFRDTTNANKHINSQSNKCSTALHSITKIKCYQLVCGRYHPISQSQNIQKNPTGTTMPDNSSINNTINTNNIQQSNALPQYAAAVLPTQAEINMNPALKYTKYFSSLPSNITTDTSITESILSQLIDKGDITKHWIKIFYQFISTHDFFIEWLTMSLQSDHLKLDLVMPSNKPLNSLLDLFIDLEGHTKHIASEIPANWKAQLVKFEVQRDDNVDIEGANTWTFRHRNNPSPQLREFGYLLCFLHHFKCPILFKFLTHVKTTAYSHAEASRCGIIANLLFELAVDTPTNGDYIPWVCRFVLFRCFHIVKGSVTLKKSSQCGKLFATLLYMLRQGVLACACRMLNGNHSNEACNMIRSVQQSHVINIISPWIAICRDMTNEQAQKETSHVTVNGDIVCGNATFQKCIYTQLIPLVRTAICDIFSSMFVGNDWKIFIDNKHKIHVSEYTTCLC